MIGAALPPLVITFGNLQSYIIQAGFVAIVCLPMIFMLIATLIYWKWYDLTREKVAINKQKLAEIGL